MTRRRTSGFTLIELMIVVVIVSILAAVAYPSYQESVRRSRRADGKGALMNCVNIQERWFTRKNTYSSSTSRCPATSDEGYYTVAIATGNSTSTGCTSPGTAPYNCFTITATATSKGGQDQDTNCAKLIIDSTGAKTSQNASGGDTTNTGSCWER